MQSIAVPGQVDRTQRRGGWFGVLRQWRTYRSLLYLALLFPLSYIYGALLVNGQVAGNDLLWFVTYLILIFAGSWLVAMGERTLARWLLGVRFTPMVAPQPAPLSPWERLKAHVRNPVAWKALVYLALRIPCGFVAPIVALALLLIPLALIVTPALYIACVAVMRDALYPPGAPDLLSPFSQSSSVHNLAVSWQASQFTALYQFTPGAFFLALVLAALGLALIPGMLRMTNALASGWGWVARQLLGSSPKDVELAEARALTAQARSRAEHADQSRRDLILNASHELRTPIASVRAHLDSLLLLEGDQLPENIRAFIGVAQREVERLGALVDDLLMLARADSDRLTLSVIPVAVGEVVEEVFQALEPLAHQEREVTLVRHVDPGLPAAYADRDRLAQVLLNLVRNAITYTPSGGIVAIELTAGEAHTLALTVADTGVGIAPEDSERVFERFYRADASRARNTGGTGLGLSIARDLVVAMGGSIGVETIPEGGSRFRVVLRAVSA